MDLERELLFRELLKEKLEENVSIINQETAYMNDVYAIGKFNEELQALNWLHGLCSCPNEIIVEYTAPIEKMIQERVNNTTPENYADRYPELFDQNEFMIKAKKNDDFYLDELVNAFHSYIKYMS